MSHSISKLIGAAFLSLLFAATTPAQSLTPEAVVDDFVKAWNSHDVKAFDRLFTVDAVWVPVAEARIVVHAKFMEDGKEVPVLDRAMIIVAVKQADGWRIAAGQLTKQHEGA